MTKEDKMSDFLSTSICCCFKKIQEKWGGSTRQRESTKTLKPYSLCITPNSFKLEHYISLNNYIVFILKQFAIIHHQKQLATESGHIEIRTFVNRCQYFTMCIYICVVDLPHTVCVFGCAK